LTHLIGNTTSEEIRKNIIPARLQKISSSIVGKKFNDAGQKTVRDRFSYGRISKEFLCSYLSLKSEQSI